MSHDTWLHRGVRAVVRSLVSTRITPNHITTARLVTGLLSAALFAAGGSTARYYAAACFLLSMLLDRADGELARISGKTSRWGHQYDLVSDALSNALVFVGIGIGLRASQFGWAAIPMGIIAGAAVGLILQFVMHVEALHGARAAEIRATQRFDPDDAMVLIPVAAVLDLLQLILAAATIGAPLFAWLAYRYRWRGLLTGRTKRKLT
jgi:archaetidylinositol phosphate synthase